MCSVICASRNEVDRGPGSRERFDASSGLGWLLRAFCYCCSSVISRWITIAIGPQPCALASVTGVAVNGAGLYAGVALPNADTFVMVCATPWYAGVAPSQVPSQPPLSDDGCPGPL